jgi:selenocysteine-specific elongation factor
VDDELMIYPQGISAKVRNIQIHEQDVKMASAGQRTAINLAGVTTGQITRGSVIAPKGSVYVTKIMDVYFSLTKKTRAVVKKMDRLKMYLGAKELVGKFIPLGVRQAAAGEEAYAQVLLEQEAVVRKGDVFVLRAISPVETIGGGRVVDPTVTRYKKIDQAVLENVYAKDTGSVMDALEAFVKAHPFQTQAKLKELLNSDAIESDLEQLLREERLIGIQGRYIHIDTADLSGEEIKRILREYHAKYPLRSGMFKAELQSRQSLISNEKEFDLLLGWLEQTEAISTANGSVSLKNFSPTFSAEQRGIRAALEEQVRKAGFTLFSRQELTGNNPEKNQVLEIMLQDTLMSIGGQLVISRGMYRQAREIVMELAGQHGAIKLSDYRDKLQTSRKYALLLLERFDKERLTKRSGEDRILLSKEKIFS